MQRVIILRTDDIDGRVDGRARSATLVRRIKARFASIMREVIEASLAGGGAGPRDNGTAPIDAG